MNGATGVTSWQLMSGEDAEQLMPSGRVRAAGFEATLPIDRTAKVGVGRALDADGDVLGATDPFALRDGEIATR